jgi:hypothetical protein
VAAALTATLDKMSPDAVAMPLGIFHDDRVLTSDASIDALGHRASLTWLVYADARVGAAILTYNRVDEALLTVERMLALPERPSIVLVDNGSTDGTREALSRRHPNIRVLTMTGNLGAAARNAGVAALAASP